MLTRAGDTWVTVKAMKLAMNRMVVEQRRRIDERNKRLGLSAGSNSITAGAALNACVALALTISRAPRTVSDTCSDTNTGNTVRGFYYARTTVRSPRKLTTVARSDNIQLT